MFVVYFNKLDKLDWIGPDADEHARQTATDSVISSRKLETTSTIMTVL